MSDLGPSQTSDHKRRLPSYWVIQVCPGCNGLVDTGSDTHLGDCEYRGKVYVPRSVPVTPASAGERAIYGF